MKQLLFLLLFPCLAMAQYPGNAGQKITLGEQTTADGLVYRGLVADTTRKPSVDTMAYILLDTNTNIIWQYKKATNNAWTRVGGSISSGVTGVLPVANGGTNTTALTANKVMVGNGTSGVLTPIRLHWDNTNFRLGVGLRVAPQYKLHITAPMGQDFLNYTENDSTPITRFGIMLENSYAKLLFNSYNTPLYLSSFLAGGTGGVVAIQTGVGFGVTTERMRVNSSGNVGIGTTTPTAVLHLKAGTATASTAPLKFTSGTNLTTPEAGVMEFNGTNLFFSPSTTRHTVNHGLTGSATLDFLSTNAQNSRDMTIAVTGAADGDVVSLGVPNAAVNANTSYSAWVSAANTVTVRFNNYSSGTVDPASGLFKVFVTK